MEAEWKQIRTCEGSGDFLVVETNAFAMEILYLIRSYQISEKGLIPILMLAKIRKYLDMVDK